MTVKDILKDAILFTNNNHLLALNFFDETSLVQPTEDQTSMLDLYLRCFNFVYKEIALGYFPLFHEEIIEFENNKFFINNLQKKLLKIKKITEKNKKIKYFLYPDNIFAETSKAKIVYSYLPNDLNFEDEVNLFSGRILPQILAYGVAREFEFILGNYSDADMWQARFLDSLKNSVKQNDSYKIPERRFF